MGGTKTHEAVQLLKGFNADPVEAATLVEKVPTPSPGKDEVLVHLLCRPINPSDLMALKGVYPSFQPKKFPIAVGSEGMGKISEVLSSCLLGLSDFHINPISIEHMHGVWRRFPCLKESLLSVLGIFYSAYDSQVLRLQKIVDYLDNTATAHLMILLTVSVHLLESMKYLCS